MVICLFFCLPFNFRITQQQQQQQNCSMNVDLQNCITLVIIGNNKKKVRTRARMAHTHTHKSTYTHASTHKLLNIKYLLCQFFNIYLVWLDSFFLCLDGWLIVDRRHRHHFHLFVFVSFAIYRAFKNFIHTVDLWLCV